LCIMLGCCSCSIRLFTENLYKQASFVTFLSINDHTNTTYINIFKTEGIYYICINRSEKAGQINKAVLLDGSFVPSIDKTHHYTVVLQWETTISGLPCYIICYTTYWYQRFRGTCSVHLQCRYRQYIPLKYKYLSTRVHYVTSQKTTINLFSAMII